MKNRIFFSLILAFSFSMLKAQSYLYDKGASGPAFTYGRLQGINTLAVDFTFNGQVSIGGTVVGFDQDGRVYGINGIANMLKIQRKNNLVSLPLIVAYQKVNSNHLLTYGAGFFVKSYVSDEVSTAIGFSYVRNRLSNSFSNNNFGQFGVDVLLFYKTLRAGPSFVLTDNQFSFGFTFGFAFNHREIPRPTIHFF
ncbi:MAG: hypothetical protein WAU01_12800 [Saprospiraceae bacterium]